MSKISLLLLFGGESAEHEVSIRSARNVYTALDKEKYDTSLCYIDQHGRWWLADAVEAQQQPDTVLRPALGESAFVTAAGKRLSPQVLLPILHGPNGEDGSAQGLAQLLHIPIVGSGILGSAMCMDKDVTKRLLTQAGIMVASGVVHHAADPAPDYEQISKQLGGRELFVKPANLGSSVGVNKVRNAEEYTAAVAQAHRYDRKILIERAIDGRELECSVLGNDQPEASVVGEILPGEEFYSYAAKYAAGSATKTTARPSLPDGVADRLRAMAIAAYRALECRGLARVDFFLDEAGELFVNEINTLPGFTHISMYPQLWEASGLSYAQLIDKLVALATEVYTVVTE